MKRYLFILLPVILLSCGVPQRPAETAEKNAKTAVVPVLTIDKGNVAFDDYFIDKTMRFDYFHTGTAKE